MFTSIGRDLSSSFTPTDGTDGNISVEGDATESPGWGGLAMMDGVDFAPAMRSFERLYDFGTWNGESKPKKDEKTTIQCPPGTEPITTISGRDVVIVCRPPSPDKPDGGIPVPIID